MMMSENDGIGEARHQEDPLPSSSVPAGLRLSEKRVGGKAQAKARVGLLIHKFIHKRGNTKPVQSMRKPVPGRHM